MSDGIGSRFSAWDAASNPGPSSVAELVPACRRVSAGHAAISHVLGPCGPRPVPLVVLEEGVPEPARRHTSGSRPARAIAIGRHSGRSPTLGTGERAPRGSTSAEAPSAALSRDMPHGEHATEDHQGDPRAVAVVHVRSLRPGAAGRTTTNTSTDPSMPIPAGRLSEATPVLRVVRRAARWSV